MRARSTYKHPAVERRRRRLLRAGLCTVCGKARIARMQRCEPCARKHGLVVRRRAARLKAEGRCTICGQRGRAGRTLCATCTKKSTAGQRERFTRLFRRGLCVRCAKPRGEDGTAYYCRKHADAYTALWRRRVERRVALGLCAQCGAATDGRRFCPKHARSAAVQSRNAKRAIVGAGCCQACYKPRGNNGTTWYCRPCADKHTASELRRQYRVGLRGTPPP